MIYFIKGGLFFMEPCNEKLANLIPEDDHVFGEVLKQIQSLRTEAQTHENKHWNDEFEAYCDNITEFIKKQKALSGTTIHECLDIIKEIRKSGQTAQRVETGQISEKALLADYDMDLAYRNDEGYDKLCNALLVIIEDYQQTT